MIDTEIFIDTPKVDLRNTELLRSEFGNPQMSFENYSRMLQGDNSLDLNLQPADNFEEMFPSEVLPEELEKEDPFNFDPIDFSTPPIFEQFNRELGYTPPEYEMIGTEEVVNEDLTTNDELEALNSQIDQIPNLTDIQRQQLEAEVSRAYSESKKTNEIPEGIGSITPSNQVSLLQDQPIKINPGFNTDLENFFSSIKNPPHWRVLGN